MANCSCGKCKACAAVIKAALAVEATPPKPRHFAGKIRPGSKEWGK